MANQAEIQAVKNRFGIIGNAPALNYALSVSIQVAPTDLSVLITGESGSGKESFSKIIHNLSHRKHNQFIAINCGAIPAGTIDSELFGHEKGAFTGAIDSRKGYFETTNQGTIFLDEIGEMPIETQSRLLRVLENGEFISVGSSKVKKSDVRIIAATNVNLSEAVEKGKFREDLYYRLNTVPIFVPPLRERGQDIEILFRYFSTSFSEKQRIEAIDLTNDAVQLLVKFRFPGNIRQLKNIAEQITILEPNRVVNAENLSRYLPKDQSSGLPALLRDMNGGTDGGFSERDLLYKVLFEMRKDMTELKKMVFSAMGSGFSSENFQNQEHFSTFKADESHFQTNKNMLYENEYENANDPYIRIEQNPSLRDNVEDIEQISTETETLSLEKKEKEMIIKALKVNNFRRRNAAIDLGISERTLYRKIKQYDIEG
jgi:transcriptional regulator with PAS, ATPase and Fis domain